MNAWLQNARLCASLSLAMLVLACGLAGVATPRWEAEAMRLAATAVPAARVQRVPADPVALPEAADPIERVPSLLESALREGVAVRRLQQRLVKQPHVERLQVQMSVRADYGQLRGFIATALGADTALALDRVQMRRASTQSAEVEAELQWSLLRAHPNSRNGS